MSNESPVTPVSDADPWAGLAAESVDPRSQRLPMSGCEPPARVGRQQELEMEIIGQLTTSPEDAALMEAIPPERFTHVMPGDTASLTRFLFRQAQDYHRESGRLLTVGVVESRMKLEGFSLKRGELGERTASLLVQCQSGPFDRQALPQMLLELEANHNKHVLRQRMEEVKEILLTGPSGEDTVTTVLARMGIRPEPGVDPLQVLSAVSRDIGGMPAAAALAKYFGNWDSEHDRNAWEAAICRPRPDIDLTTGNLTDVGYAERLAALHGEDVRWVPAWGKWLVWDGSRWRKDEEMIVERLGAAIASRTLQAFVTLGPGDPRRTEGVRRALARESSSSIRGSLEQLKHLVAIRPDVFDRDRWALNVTNGTLDLRTGQLRTHDRSDMITKIANVSYDADAACPLWEAFLRKVFDGDTELISYVQKLVGMTLCGVIADHCFIILNGNGCNGKSTFIEVVRLLTGSYAGKMDKSLLLAKKWGGGSGHSDALAAMRGVRFASADETDDSDALSEAFIKQLTSGERVSARAIYSPTTEFDPELTLWLDTNHLPAVHRGGHAMWRRIQLIPFGVTIRPLEKINNYAEKMVDAEGPGILRWAVEGCLRWQSEGLAEQPRAVAEATGAYRTEEDKVRRFLDERCITTSGLEVGSTDLYQAYRDWCEQQGHQAESQKKLVGRLRSDHGIDIRKASRGNVLVGVGLRPEGMDLVDDVDGESGTHL